MEKNEQIKKLLSDDSFLKEFSETKSEKEAAELFVKHGVQVTESDIKKMFAESSGELSDENLDSVAGGVVNTNIQNILRTIKPVYNEPPLPNNWMKKIKPKIF